MEYLFGYDFLRFITPWKAWVPKCLFYNIYMILWYYLYEDQCLLDNFIWIYCIRQESLMYKTTLNTQMGLILFCYTPTSTSNIQLKFSVEGVVDFQQWWESFSLYFPHSFSLVSWGVGCLLPLVQRGVIMAGWCLLVHWDLESLCSEKMLVWIIEQGLAEITEKSITQAQYNNFLSRNEEGDSMTV